MQQNSPEPTPTEATSLLAVQPLGNARFSPPQSIDRNLRLAQDTRGLAAVSSIIEPAGPVVTRGRRARAPAPISTAEVRRSNRSNKYNGFKINQVTDARPTISRVKPRLVPSIGSSSSAQETHSDNAPPTPVHVLQEIGINRCAVPAAELTEEILNAAPEPASKSTARTGTLLADDLAGEEDISRA